MTIMLFYIFLITFIATAAVRGSDGTATVLLTEKVFLDLEIGGQYTGRVVIGLFGSTSPKTVRNFVGLANHEKGYGYRGSIFHRIVPNFMIQGGDFTNYDGTGGYSLYGGMFRDEDFILDHYGAGWVCMANAGPNTNGSQFYITVVKCPWLDGTHTCFGKVLEGMDIIYRASNIATDTKEKPLQNVTIIDCGSMDMENPYFVDKSSAL